MLGKGYFLKISLWLENLKYLNRGLIFTADIIFSAIGTIMTFSFVTMLTNQYFPDEIIQIITLSTILISSITFFSFKLYKVVIRHSTIRDASTIINCLILKVIAIAIIVYLIGIFNTKTIVLAAISDLAISSLLMIGTRALLVNIYYNVINPHSSRRKHVFIYGSEGQSPAVASLITANHQLKYKVEGFLTTKQSRNGIRINKLPVIYLNRENLDKLFAKYYKVRAVVFLTNETFIKEKNNLVDYCINNNISMLMSPDLKTATGQKEIVIKEIEIEDILDRDQIHIDTDKIEKYVTNKTVMITGAAGSIGSEMVRQLAKFPVKRLVLVDNSETPLHSLSLKLACMFPNSDIIPILGDIRSRQRIAYIVEKYNPNIVFHAAAYKHVPIIEINPCEAILANVLGTKNVADIALRHGVEKFIMVSTDKAVNPTNIMGASKRIAEMYVQSLNTQSPKTEHSQATQFIITRFGNVLGSNGSVIPLFREQIKNGGPITVTHPEVIRYFMTIPEACRLVLQATNMGKGGEIFTFDMGEQVSIVGLAKKMISLAGLVPEKDIKIVYTGLRPGEKLYEELLSTEENSDFTVHKKIRIAHIKDIDYNVINQDVKELIKYAMIVNIEQTVIKMKQIVPEFISKNSKFEKYDV